MKALVMSAILAFMLGFIVFFILAIIEDDFKYKIRFGIGGAICTICFAIFLCIGSQTKMVAVYNAYEYDIKSIINKYETCSTKKYYIKYKTDSSNLLYVTVEEYLYPGDYQYRITIYNNDLAEMDMSEYKLEAAQLKEKYNEKIIYRD